MTKKYELVYDGSDFDLIRTFISPFNNKISKIKLEPKPIRIAYNYDRRQIILEYFENSKQKIKYFNMGNFTIIGRVVNSPNKEDFIIIPLTIYTCTKRSDLYNGIYTEYICKRREEFTIDEKQAITKYYKDHMITSLIEHGSFPNHMPGIRKVFFNDPYTTIKWTDDTTTTVKCRDDEKFNKEIGVSMAISRKYFELNNPTAPRAKFKEIVKNATDQTKLRRKAE